MITGRWGRPSQVLLDISVDADGNVTGLANPGAQNAVIDQGHFDTATGAVHLEGMHRQGGADAISFQIDGRLEGRTLRLAYRFGERSGEIEIVRVEEYRPPPLTLADRLKPRAAALQRWLTALRRPSGAVNARKLRARGESIEAIVCRDATFADVDALADLHVITWNATYNTSKGPSVATRLRQWRDVFSEPNRRDFVVVLENQAGQLIGFTWGKPGEGEFGGQLSKIYLRWAYHGLGLGRRLMIETARRFRERGIDSFILFAELSNPTLGFYDRLGGERLRDDRGRFNGAYGWRSLDSLLGGAPRMPPLERPDDPA